MSVLEVAPDEALVSQPSRKTIFAARRSDLRLVKVPRYPQFGGGGMKVGEAPGEAVQFSAGQFAVPEDGEVVLSDGRKADGAAIIKWLREHKLFGDPMGGFWEVQTAAPPVSSDEITRIVDAALAFDTDTLHAILVQERAGWERDEVISQVEATIVKIEAARERERELAEAAAAQAKAEAEAKAKADADAKAKADELARKKAEAEAKKAAAAASN